jgi:dihydropteroate synthase
MDADYALRVLWKLRERTITFPRRPLLMGIVNVNDDSFCGDGTLDCREALGRAHACVDAGADVVDVGAESARTNRAPITVDEEIRRIGGVLGGWNDMWKRAIPRDPEQIWPPVLSVNTWRPEVVEFALGFPCVELVNDMGTLPDATNARLCAAVGASLLIMHGAGQPKIAQVDRMWDDVVVDMELFFREKIGLARSAGLDPERIILDPGIDFAKQRDDNLAVYRNLDRFRAFGRPLMVPVSRKTVIGRVLGITNPLERDAGTMACIAMSMRSGAEIFRVHDVDAAWSAVKVLWSLR